MMGKYKPFIDLGPGDTIKEELEYYGWEQKDLAEIMSRSEKSISNLLTNKVPIIFETALQLSKIFKQSPQFWLNLDANYRLRMQENATVESTAAKALIYRYMPIRELRRYLNLPRKTETLVANVCDFWGMDKLDFGFLEEQAVANFRKSTAYNNFNPYYALSWLQLIGKHVARVKTHTPYSAEKLQTLARNIPEYTSKEHGIPEFLNALADCGVIFLQLNHMPQTYTDGAAYWDKNRPVIAYTARYDRNDNFWFTITHEIAHILLHKTDTKSFFIDSMDHLDIADKKEQAANDFAEDILKTKEILKEFITTKRPSAVRIKMTAKILGIHPGVIAGCLQYHQQAAYTSFHELKTDVIARIPAPFIIPKLKAQVV